MSASYDQIDDSKKRSTSTYSSEDAAAQRQTMAHSVGLNYYCTACWQLALSLDTRLDSFPQRKTDQATVVPQQRVKQTRLKEGGTKTLKRAKGAERQYRLNCPGCSLWIAYTSQPDPQPTDAFLYVVNKSLAQAVPTDALPSCIKQDTADSVVKLTVLLTLGATVSQVVAVDWEFVMVEIAANVEEPKVNSELLTVISHALEISRDDVKFDLTKGSQGFLNGAPSRTLLLHNCPDLKELHKKLLMACSRTQS